MDETKVLTLFIGNFLYYIHFFKKFEAFLFTIDKKDNGIK